MNSNLRNEVMSDTLNTSTLASSGALQNPFSSSIDLEWHNSPEGRGVLAHLTDQANGQRRNYGRFYRT